MRTTVSLLLLMALGLGGILIVDRLPPQHSPWAPLDLGDPAGFATGFKLARLRGDPERCLGVLDRSALEIAPIDDRNEGGFCGLRNAVAIERSAMRYSLRSGPGKLPHGRRALPLGAGGCGARGGAAARRPGDAHRPSRHLFLPWYQRRRHRAQPARHGERDRRGRVPAFRWPASSRCYRTGGAIPARRLPARGARWRLPLVPRRPQPGLQRGASRPPSPRYGTP